ncbi:hypothetical protein SAMD00019534_075460 [Acytostelium subglobosum LB1]|uniref:hypothetical protein n=1 Tax=Acytostelium subglobosum LB1 TaxID=1410327 RepID=UPI000644F170|nr:hypothetical protein SAMD00019534_075460 [Acytostelium subglobosum LB1]GAM24371.1 hypothetical protein SAMD00019534_075460 [Acytostelium subglobosum LB1]|eukprot:XP_012752697.1 hypothetical protein SAMD00019534_075460 [Acytostelium subglobosum LB1]
MSNNNNVHQQHHLSQSINQSSSSSSSGPDLRREYYVREFDVTLAGTKEPTSVQYFINGVNEPIYFPDRTLAALFHCNLSTLRGRFNRLTKDPIYNGHRVLISEKSKTRLSTYHYINWGKRPSISGSSSSSSTGLIVSPPTSLSNNSDDLSPLPTPYTLSPAASPTLNSATTTKTPTTSTTTTTSAGSSPLHGLVALNHFKLVNIALSEWIAANYDRLGTHINIIIENFQKCQIPYRRVGDVLSIVVEQKEDLHVYGMNASGNVGMMGSLPFYQRTPALSFSNGGGGQSPGLMTTDYSPQSSPTTQYSYLTQSSSSSSLFGDFLDNGYDNSSSTMTSPREYASPQLPPPLRLSSSDNSISNNNNYNGIGNKYRPSTSLNGYYDTIQRPTPYRCGSGSGNGIGSGSGSSGNQISPRGLKGGHSSPHYHPYGSNGPYKPSTPFQTVIEERLSPDSRHIEVIDQVPSSCDNSPLLRPDDRDIFDLHHQSRNNNNNNHNSSYGLNGTSAFNTHQFHVKPTGYPFNDIHHFNNNNNNHNSTTTTMVPFNYNHNHIIPGPSTLKISPSKKLAPFLLQNDSPPRPHNVSKPDIPKLSFNRKQECLEGQGDTWVDCNSPSSSISISTNNQSYDNRPSTVNTTTTSSTSSNFDIKNILNDQ